jgi:hypothetical protein
MVGPNGDDKQSKRCNTPRTTLECSALQVSIEHRLGEGEAVLLVRPPPLHVLKQMGKR